MYAIGGTFLFRATCWHVCGTAQALPHWPSQVGMNSHAAEPNPDKPSIGSHTPDERSEKSLSSGAVLFGLFGRGVAYLPVLRSKFCYYRLWVAVTFSESRFGCRRCGKLQSFFANAIAPKTFLREVPLTTMASSSAGGRRGLILVRIPHRKGHSIQRVVLAGLDNSPKTAASTVSFELAQTGGISGC